MTMGLVTFLCLQRHVGELADPLPVLAAGAKEVDGLTRQEDLDKVRPRQSSSVSILLCRIGSNAWQSCRVAAAESSVPSLLLQFVRNTKHHDNTGQRRRGLYLAC